MRRAARTTAVAAFALALAAPAGAGPLPRVVGDARIDHTALAHDSRDPVYRSPGGAVPAGTVVRLGFRTGHGDATGVRVRVLEAVSGRSETVPMRPAGSVACDEGAGTCDLWVADIRTPLRPDTLYYRFTASDGPVTVTYTDDRMLDGGRGTAADLTLGDLRSCCASDYTITVYDPAFVVPSWMRDAVVYQIFPDRFRNGDPSNDPDDGRPRYGWPSQPADRITRRAWGTAPEGACRAYATTPCDSQPRGRDFFGGDLAGITQSLDELDELGVNVLYLNPIFDAASNHAYDTRDHTRIAPSFGTDADFAALVSQASARGIRVVLDGVFSSMSSDSPAFDRYGHFPTSGACEDPSSPYRSWFVFTAVPTGPCAGTGGLRLTGYESWYGFDVLPLLDKTAQPVRDYLYGAGDSVVRRWLRAGASGWRIDSMEHPSFPDGFWSELRGAVKATDPQAAIVGELWHKAEALPKVRGDTADTLMNYRFRNAVQGFLGRIDGRGFPDDGESNQPAGLFASKVSSVLEDYPPMVSSTAWNLLGSHDTERALWSLTPGVNDPSQKEHDPARFAQGLTRMRLAVVLQMTLPGVPVIYYGDEVGLTGYNDPDDRRTFPWGPDGPAGDAALRSWYAMLIAQRRDHAVLRDGELRFLSAGDDVVAFARRDASSAAVVAVNRASSTASVRLRVGDLVADGTAFSDALGSATGTVSGGILAVDVPAQGAALLLSADG